jgi:3-deoxy-D-manno-octulosonic-acid transferase
VGIHNTLEAAVWDVPVIFGPNNEKFQEAQGLKACEGGFEIKDFDDFKRLMNRFEGDADSLKKAGQQAGNYVKQLSGATKRILSDVKL